MSEKPTSTAAEAIVDRVLKAGPDKRLQALIAIEELVDIGFRTTAATRIVAMRSGIGIRTLYGYRKVTNFLPRAEWAATLARKPRLDRLGMQVDCHPLALERFVDLCRHGIAISEGYRRTVVEAAEKGWLPIPSERTLRRELVRQVDPVKLRKARRHGVL